MTVKRYDIAVYIGRFQPLHNGHVQTIINAAKIAKRVVVIVGSASKSRSYKNPFYFGERKAIIINAEREFQISRNTEAVINVEANIDTMYDDNAWMVRVQKIVNSYALSGNEKIAIIGHGKDESSAYLRWFPQWDLIEQELVEPLDASQIRSLYFSDMYNPNFIRSVVPSSTIDFLTGFSNSNDYSQIIREREFIAKYKKQFESLPYPPIFVTADAVVAQAGHVLLIKRRAEPGKGLWALPGGFVNANTDKSVEDAAIRELIEETQIKLPEKVLRGSIVNRKVFDAINRSERGRTITHAFHIRLIDGEWNLPKIKGSDDAEKAQWVPLGKVRSEEMFEDHFDIIQYFLGVH